MARSWPTAASLVARDNRGLDAAELYERGVIGLAGFYVLASVALSVMGLFAGMWVVRQIG